MELDQTRLCSRDGFPKVKIAGRWECVAEYLDRCIGGQRVVDLVDREGTVYYVFESGHELPMLCFCCGGPLAYADLEESRRNMVGRRLESMAVDPVELEDGRELLQFRLELSGKGLLSQPVSIPVSVQVAAQMCHPVRCPYRSGTSAARTLRKRNPSAKRRR